MRQAEARFDHIEQERYEISSFFPDALGSDRRTFLKLFGSGLVVILAAPAALAQSAESGFQRQGARGFRVPMPKDIAAWLRIDPSGKVTVFTGKVEIGQGVRTSLAQAVAEELSATLESIELIMGDTDLTPFDMGTFGSRTTATMGVQLRRVAAAARGVLLERAADRLKRPKSDLSTSDGRVRMMSKPQIEITYGELVAGGPINNEIPDQIAEKDPAQWRVIDRPAQRVDGLAKVTGRALYADDLRLPGMLVGKVIRPPSFGAKLINADLSAAQQVPGLVKAFVDGNFIGIAAENQEAAYQAAEKIQAQWKEEKGISDREIYQWFKNQAKPSRSLNQRGDLEQGFAEAEVRLQQSYRLPYIAHASMEPRSATAEWKEGRLLVHVGTQRPFGCKSELADFFKIPENQVHVVVPATGSAFGGKHTADAAIEAARIARAVGRPVRLAWTRTEEFTWAYFRPAAYIEIRSGFKSDGTLTAWEFHNYNSGERGAVTPYSIKNSLTIFHPVESPLRQGSYRGLANPANTFAREVHLDEISELTGLDPVALRLKNLADPRLVAVLNKAVEISGWASAGERKNSMGLALAVDAATYVAEVAEVEADSSGRIAVTRVWAAVDCGAVVNPDILRNQIEGAIVQAVGYTLREKILFEGGKILTSSFSDYLAPRISDLPAIEIAVVNNPRTPSTGIGEPPAVPLAAAVANAASRHLKKRFRSLPLNSPLD